MSRSAPNSTSGTSLRRRWNRAVAAITVSLLACGVVSVSGSVYLVSAYRQTAHALAAQASLLANLRAAVVKDSIALSNAAGDPALLRAAAANSPSIDAAFGQGTAAASPAGQRALREGRTAWTNAVNTILALDPATPMAGRRVAIGLALSVQAPKVLALLDEAATASRSAARLQLAAHRRAATWIIGGLTLASVLGLAQLVRFGRRLSHDVLAPVDRLRSSVNLLAAGDLSHRAEVYSGDELGALAVSFNSMADAIAGSQQVLSEQANHDALTGLANSSFFRRRVEESLSREDRRAGTQAVLFLDLDDFKYVNDQLGHTAGDELLREVASRLNRVIRPQDLVARLGGDEFALHLDGIPDVRAAVQLAERAVSVLAQPIDVGGESVQVGVSVGVAMRHADSRVGSIMQQADMAMYSAKGHGKNRVECYDQSLHRAEEEHRALKADIHAAAGRDELVLDYQPVVDLDTGALIAVEALVRWQHPTRGLLPPSAFIELAEQTGAIIGIGEWVLRTATEQMHNWQRRYLQAPLAVAVNVSARQLMAADFPRRVQEILVASDLDPASLVLEVTESVLVDDTSKAAAALGELRQLGIRVSIDDFGTGFASIGYLRTLPVDSLKIDRSFVSGPQAQGPGVKFLEAVITLGRQLGLEIIPEGIEHPEELARLRALGCRVGQGFLLSRPVPAGDIETWLSGAVPPLPIEFYGTTPPTDVPMPSPRPSGRPTVH
jgi:diguanylate cyclase (GGDEF)-like protein